MKKIILSLLIIFISLPAPAASAPRTADLEITVLYKEDRQPSAAAFIKISNADIGWQVDTNGKHTISNVSAGQEYTISEMGNKNITYIVSENDMQKQSDGSYLIKKTFYLEPDENDTITASKIGTCTEKELTKINATNGHFINNQCQPTKCIEPRYELFVISGSMEKNPELYRATCTDLDGTDCFDIDDINALTGVYKYNKETNELNCVSASCIEGYRVDKKTKKCMVTKCPCGEEERDNMCLPWLDKKCTTMPANAATAERDCDGDREYCKILTCNGDEHKKENLHEFELDTKQNKCVSRVGGKCTPTDIDHATGGKYQKSGTPYKLFCAVTECDATYTPNDNGTACELSGCTNEQEDKLKTAHATSWKLADDKKNCIPTKCECGYGTVDGKPVNGTCNTPKWSWNNDNTPPEETKIECQKDNASKAYMDCREDGKAYCRVHECDETNGFTLYGNECIQDACDPKKYPNALYVKRVGNDCIIQECITGYNVNTKENKCEPRDDLLSEEDSEARIKELQENEDAVAENAQTWENKLLGTAGIGGAGAGGQMLASGIAQRVADEAAERDMTAYLATFRCKYGNESVDSGGDEVQLPGANDKTYASLLSEYKTLAASLKMRKNALGMAPGIESDEILDGSTLYGRGNTGGADGTYLSLADALSGDSDAQNEWDEQKEKANALAIGGGVLAGGAIIGTAIGSAKVNKDAPKNKADEINKEYDKKRGTIVDEEAPQPAQGEGEQISAAETAAKPNQTTKTPAEQTVTQTTEQPAQ